MKNLKRGLAWILTVLMLATTLPATALAEDAKTGTDNPTEQVSVDDMMEAIMETAVQYMYTDGSMTTVLVVDAQYKGWCQSNVELLAAAGTFNRIGYFAKDGSYTIRLPEGTDFSEGIVFFKQEDYVVQTFADMGAAEKVYGHDFTVVYGDPLEVEDDVHSNAGVSPLGLQYITTITKSEVDLTGYFEEELKKVPLSKLLPGVNLENVSALAWDSAYDQESEKTNDYTVLKKDPGPAETIDLSGLLRSSKRSGNFNGSHYTTTPYSTYELEILNSDDQLNTKAIRYIVPVRIPDVNALLKLDAAYTDQSKLRAWQYTSNLDYTMAPDLPIWDVKNVKVSMKFNPNATTSGLTAKVFKETYTTAGAAEASGQEITGQIWEKGANGCTADWTKKQPFTVCLYRNNVCVQLLNLSVQMDYRDVGFSFDLATVAEGNKESEAIEIGNLRRISSNKKTYYYLYPANYDNWESGEALLKLGYSIGYSDYKDQTTVAVYTGYYENEEALNTAVAAGKSKDVSTEIWGDTAKGYKADYNNLGKLQAFTVVVKDVNKATAYFRQFYVYVAGKKESPVWVNFDDALYIRSGSSPYYTYSPVTSKGEEASNGTYYFTMQSTAAGETEYPANGKYYVRFQLEGGELDADGTDNRINKIDKIVVGTNKNGTDIKTALLSDFYQVDFANQPVIFTVYYKDVDGEAVAPQEIRLRTLVGTPDDSKAQTFSTDTYFNVLGVEGYKVHVMKPYVDTGYKTGFQVVFVDATKEDLESKDITITYSTGSNVKMFKRHDEKGERISTVNQTTEKVTSGVPLLFSAASESGTHLRNYWVTFVAKDTSGPKLWINGQGDADHKDEETGLPQREIYLNSGSYNSGYYDILFANVGNAPLTGLEVKLSDNANIRLDDYWTIKSDGVKTLAPFTSVDKKVSSDEYSELENMAKIRIWPKEGVKKGDIDAVLTISADGQAPVSIKLTGKVGQAAIVSSAVPDGVKYVPYSCLIQTTFQSLTGNDPNRPTFRIVGGALPSNVTINEKTGEIYGVPRAYGTFRFTVGIYQGGEMVDSKAFTMEIADNTDKDVWDASDGDQYKVIEPIGEGGNSSTGAGYTITLKESGPVSEDIRTFVSEGPYLYYVKVFLDSNLLTAGTDYTHDEGSTKIVLMDSTLNKYNTNGKHTLAIEFRENDTEQKVDDQTYQGTLKRTSQNYYIEGGINPSNNNNSSSNSGTNYNPPVTDNSGSSRPSSSSSSKPSSSNNNSSSSNTPSTPSTPSTPATPAENDSLFPDVRRNDWFYNDVLWAVEKGLMVGVSGDAFDPNVPISQAMIVVVLARLSGVDLSPFANMTPAGAEPGQWYTPAAAWAQQSGILPDNSDFSSAGSLSRDGMAIMLTKYLASMGIDTTVGSDIAFADAAQMTADGQNAFQVLYHYGIFKGIGENKMDPTGLTTRAQFAALVHRVSDFATGR